MIRKKSRSNPQIVLLLPNILLSIRVCAVVILAILICTATMARRFLCRFRHRARIRILHRRRALRRGSGRGLLRLRQGAESACDNRLAVGSACPASAERMSPGAPARAKRHCSSADAAAGSCTRLCASAAADPPDAQPDDPHCALPVRGAVPPSSQLHAVSSGIA